MDTASAFLWPIAEVMIPILAAVIGPLLVAVLYKLFAKLGLDAEAINRDALQQAISKGALEAVRKAGGPAIATSVGEAAVRAGVDQVLASVPDAIKTFKVPTAEIAKRVEAQATAIVQATPSVAAPILAAGGHAAIDALIGAMLQSGRAD